MQGVTANIPLDSAAGVCGISLTRYFKSSTANGYGRLVEVPVAARVRNSRHEAQSSPILACQGDSIRHAAAARSSAHDDPRHG